MLMLKSDLREHTLAAGSYLHSILCAVHMEQRLPGSLSAASPACRQKIGVDAGIRTQ